VAEGDLQALVLHCFQWTCFCVVVDNLKGPRHLYTVVDVVLQMEAEAGGDLKVQANRQYQNVLSIQDRTETYIFGKGGTY